MQKYTELYMFVRDCLCRQNTGFKQIDYARGKSSGQTIASLKNGNIKLGIMKEILDACNIKIVLIHKPTNKQIVI